MSVRVMSRVWDHSEQKGSRLLALLALADWADDDGYCWPKIAQLAIKCRLDERTAKRCLADLVADGEVERAGGGGRGNPSTYRVVVGVKGDNLSPFAGDAPRREAEARKGDKLATVSRAKGDKAATFPGRERVTPVAVKGDKSGSHIENHQEPSLTTSEQTPADAGGARGRAAAPAAARKAPADPAPHQALFGDLCHAAGLSPKDLVPGFREQLGQLAARLQEEPEADRPDRNTLLAIYRAERAALSARLGRDVDALTVWQFRQAIGRWITSRRQEAEDLQARAERALREAEDNARWLAERKKAAAATATGPQTGGAPADTWRRIAEGLRSYMPQATWDAWIQHLQPLRMDGGHLVVVAPSEMAVDWLSQERVSRELGRLADAAGLVGLRFMAAADAAEERAA